MTYLMRITLAIGYGTDLNFYTCSWYNETKI